MRIALSKRRLLLLATLLAALLASPKSAVADVGETIILRCTHGESLSGFSQSAYSQALREVEADTAEYSPCPSEIRQAQLVAASGSAGAGQSTATPVAIAVTPSEQRALTHAALAGSAPLRLGDRLINPGVVQVDIASAFHSLPTPLLASLAYLLACLLLIVGGALRKRVRANRPD